MKVVLDTNVLLSGIFWTGYSNAVLTAWRNRRFSLVASADTLAEFVRVLRDFKIRMPEELQRGWLELIVANSTLVNPEPVQEKVTDDPTDDRFVECAVFAQADYLVTQDKHLLRLGRIKSTIVLTPQEFLKILD